ncbi:Uncharacterized membrane protein [Tistlia consotensis]|uniref:Uncharacterized membrane protein n=1 Tax=Tistlia consotensis USBA 355 TaxID=560819 RepID=A0A1Y6BCE8_9PROT|nr:periplasmic heavy metal sensor [Tistlia consotensis]SME96876.1 Uncharacterized membrane protein [Tistlia consotensis USBA 355]SNR56265.1 Uncharacterized membrane protein [Tistlia consotensis]
MISDRAVASWTIRIALTLSLALNLFIAGWLMGDWLRPGPPMPLPPEAGGPRPDMESALIHWIAPKLSSEGRDRLLANWQKVEESSTISNEAEIDSRRRALRDMLRQEAFDAGAFDRQMEALHKAMSSRIERLVSAITMTVPELSAADRKVLADLPPLSRIPPPGPWRDRPDERFPPR